MMKNSKSILKFILFLIISILFKTTLGAQEFKDLDKIPLDISYYRTSKIATPLVKVIYGRPSKKDNAVFGNSVKYGKIWRTGANEATEVKFYKDVLFGGIHIPAGTYVLYTIPNTNEWDVILSTNVDVWGAFQYDPVFDIAKIKVSTSKAEELTVFSIAFKEKNKKIEMVLAWDTTRVKIPLSFDTNEQYVKL